MDFDGHADDLPLLAPMELRGTEQALAKQIEVETKRYRPNYLNTASSKVPEDLACPIAHDTFALLMNCAT